MTGESATHPTNHPELVSKNESDVTRLTALGFRAAYARSFSSYFELEPALELLVPMNLGWSGKLNETRFLISVRGVLPLAGGVADPLLECETGPVVSRLLGMTSLSFALSGYLNARLWIRKTFGLIFGIGTGYLFRLTGESGTASGWASSDKYLQSEQKVIRIRAGAAFRF